MAAKKRSRAKPPTVSSTPRRQVKTQKVVIQGRKLPKGQGGKGQ